ncbi:type III secretion system export apparatus subunit SctU [Acidovorax facilis]|uniref:type III secretion system export apparatus subunit SctU n=1 Tax=Acidovorax facilis TaxID=12917 RepID=UPI003CEEAB81
MAGQDDSGDKTEKPTPKKLQDARKNGEVPKSKDLTATATLLTLLLLATVALPLAGQQMTSLIDLSLRGFQGPFSEALAQLGWQSLRTLLTLVGLVVVPVTVIGVLVEFLQAGPVLTMEKVWPKAEHLNPVSGLKRMFSLDNLVELLKSLLKTVLIAIIAWVALKSLLPDLPLLTSARPEAVGSALWHASWTLLAWVTGAFLLVSAIDLAWQRYSFMKKMRMSMRDIRQEMKDAEGDPHLKGQRKQLQQEWAQQSANKAAAGAHVLVVNPTHVAIAIDYHRDRCPVPTVIAKAQDDDALAMRTAAQEAGVPVLRNIDLARQLLADTETGDVVPAELFDLIATVILWAQDVRYEIERATRSPSAEPSTESEYRRSRRPAPGEDLTRYPSSPTHAAGDAATAPRGWRSHRFARYVPRGWRSRAATATTP